MQFSTNVSFYLNRVGTCSFYSLINTRKIRFTEKHLALIITNNHLLHYK